MFSHSKTWRGALLFIAVLYGVELLDEFIYGLFGAALPPIKTELALTYTQVGLLFTLPSLISIQFTNITLTEVIPITKADLASQFFKQALEARQMVAA